MYLMIENKGEAPIEAFSTLGVSTSRGEASKIGQFGTGAKHACLYLLREGIPFEIRSGTDRITFKTKLENGGLGSFERVVIRHNNKDLPQSYSVEFGELDWKTLDMALREFVSNALDNSEVYNVTLTDNNRARSGYTRVFIEATPDVVGYYSNLKHNFLQFTEVDTAQTFLPKQDPNKIRIYRKGVLVRIIEDKSVFDYNFGDELRIDECRNLNDYDALRAAIQALNSNSEKCQTVLQTVAKTSEEVWELKGYTFQYSNTWSEAWKKEQGDTPIVNNLATLNMVKGKGKLATYVPSTCYEILAQHGVASGLKLLTEVENKGCKIVPTTENAQRTMMQVWNWLSKLNLTGELTFPQLQCFEKPMNSGSELCGYVENNIVYINVAHDTNPQVMMEELSHYITGATDNSRDFQDFAFRIATRASSILFD